MAAVKLFTARRLCRSDQRLVHEPEPDRGSREPWVCDNEGLDFEVTRCSWTNLGIRLVQLSLCNAMHETRTLVVGFVVDGFGFVVTVLEASQELALYDDSDTAMVPCRAAEVEMIFSFTTSRFLSIWQSLVRFAGVFAPHQFFDLIPRLTFQHILNKKIFQL